MNENNIISMGSTMRKKLAQAVAVIIVAGSIIFTAAYVNQGASSSRLRDLERKREHLNDVYARVTASASDAHKDSLFAVAIAVQDSLDREILKAKAEILRQAAK